MIFENSSNRYPKGFTLIELSIVLVIIGLVVGGVLVGQDLIRAASVRAQISQIEKFGTAVNTFYGKYQALPGDLNQATATTFGFGARGSMAGQGDGNGLIQGTNDVQFDAYTGEAGMFWVDLTTANGMNLNLVSGSFSTATPSFAPANLSMTQLGLYFPASPIGRGGYVFVYNGANGFNYFGLSGFVTPFSDGVGQYSHNLPSGLNPSLTVQEAYNIDRKTDDGLPGSGRVTTATLGSGFGFYNGQIPDGQQWSPSSTTCHDTGGVVGPQEYTLSVNNGAGVNCSLAFQFP